MTIIPPASRSLRGKRNEREHGIVATPIDTSTTRSTPAPSPDDLAEPGGRRREPRPRRAGRTLARLSGPAVLIGLLAVGTARFLDDPDPPAAPVAAAETADVLGARQAAVAARPDDLLAWQALGQAYVEEAARGGDPGYYQDAADAFDRADRLSPQHPDTLVGRAGLALALHHFDQALVLGEQAQAAGGADAESLAVLIDANVELGRYDEAAELTQQLLDLRPGMAALTRASYQRELRGDLDGALTAMVQAEAAVGGADAARAGAAPPAAGGALATVVALQGDILFSAGRPEDAAARYRRALELAPGLVLAEVGLARSDAALGRLEPAGERLRGLLEHSPTLAAATLLGDVEDAGGSTAVPANGSTPGAEALVDVLVQLQRAAGGTVDLELAVHLADRGTPDVELARAAYEARPSIYGADGLAWSLTRAGRADEAIPYVEASLATGTADAALRFHAATTYAAVGRTDEARRELQTALDTNPHFGLGLRDETRSLAAQLGVALPAALSTIEESR